MKRKLSAIAEKTGQRHPGLYAALGRDWCSRKQNPPEKGPMQANKQERSQRAKERPQAPGAWQVHAVQPTSEHRDRSPSCQDSHSKTTQKNTKGKVQTNIIEKYPKNPKLHIRISISALYYKICPQRMYYKDEWKLVNMTGIIQLILLTNQRRKSL